MHLSVIAQKPKLLYVYIDNRIDTCTIYLDITQILILNKGVFKMLLRGRVFDIFKN